MTETAPAAPEPRAPPPKKGWVIVYTGDGKGKTTAALGLALRAAGIGSKVLILQFVKGTWRSAELESVARLGGLVEIRQLGIGFVTWNPKKPREEHEAAASEAWAVARKEVLSDRYDIVVLDEINNATRFELVPVDAVLALLRERPPRLHVVLTGCGADPRIIEAADLVTEMRLVKHPFEKGEWARRGIDY